jgi:hypothetical protein
MRNYYYIYENETISFLTLDAAEDYLMENYEEYYSGKDSFQDFSENMIFKGKIITCCFCDEEESDDLSEMKSSNCGEFYYHNYCSI